jgi:hypothetical protein
LDPSATLSDLKQEVFYSSLTNYRIQIEKRLGVASNQQALFLDDKLKQKLPGRALDTLKTLKLKYHTHLTLNLFKIGLET